MYYRFNGTALLMTAKDAANGLVTLAICYCGAENKFNWVLFLDCIFKVFSSMLLVISDKQKGLDAIRIRLNEAAAQLTQEDQVTGKKIVACVYALCAVQAIRNAGTKIKEFYHHATSLARSLTNNAYTFHLEN
jgi:hypothetical protein